VNNSGVAWSSFIVVVVVVRLLAAGEEKHALEGKATLFFNKSEMFFSVDLQRLMNAFFIPS